MPVDWGFAGQIGGVGFSLVFMILIILAIAIRLTGIVLSKISSEKGEVSDKRKGD